MSSPLKYKAVVVTGAGQGLGRAYAIAIAAAGASVVVNDIDGEAAQDTARTIEESGGDAIAVVGSVSSWGDAQNTVEQCVSVFGRIDGFVANAAIMYMVEPWAETESRLRAIAEVNVLGVQFGVAHAMRAMIDSGRGGSIVTIVSGAQHGLKGMSAYGASKGAVNAMTVNWAIEGADYGIRVNGVSPIGRTSMTTDHSPLDPSSFPDPATVAPLVVSLLSDETAGITGRIVRFDGQLLSTYQTTLTTLGELPSWSTDQVTEALVTQIAAAAD